MDEPCSGWESDLPTAQSKQLIDRLRQDYSVVIVTHSMQQARAGEPENGRSSPWPIWF